MLIWRIHSSKNTLQINWNADFKERKDPLTSYKYCMLKSFKENVDQTASMRNYLNDRLIKRPIISCGYLLFSLKDGIGYADCVHAVNNRTKWAAQWQILRRTHLHIEEQRICEINIYHIVHLCAKVERLLQNHFKSVNAYVRDRFEQVIAEIAGNGVLIPKVCCEERRAEISGGSRGGGDGGDRPPPPRREN